MATLERGEAVLEPVDMAAHLDKVELYLGQVCRLAGISKMQLDYWTNKAQIPTKGKKQRIYDMRRDRDRDADQAGQGQGHEPRRGDRRPRGGSASERAPASRSRPAASACRRRRPVAGGYEPFGRNDEMMSIGAGKTIVVDGDEPSSSSVCR